MQNALCKPDMKKIREPKVYLVLELHTLLGIGFHSHTYYLFTCCDEQAQLYPTFVPWKGEKASW